MPATAKRPTGWIAGAFSRADDRTTLLGVAGVSGLGGVVRRLERILHSAATDETPNAHVIMVSLLCARTYHCFQRELARTRSHHSHDTFRMRDARGIV